MDVKLIEKPAFQIVGVSQKVPLQYQGENQAIMELAQRITPQQRAEMHTFDDIYPHQVVNASFDFQEGRTTEGGEMTHMIGFATSQENTYEDLEQLSVPAHTWAVFQMKVLSHKLYKKPGQRYSLNGCLHLLPSRCSTRNFVYAISRTSRS